MYACEVWMRLMSVQVLCGDEANVLYWKSFAKFHTLDTFETSKYQNRAT